MSGTDQQPGTGDGGHVPPPGAGNGENDAEARARVLGWRPKEEFRGPAERWVSAQDFLQRGYEDPSVTRTNLHKVMDDVGRLTVQNQSLAQKLEEAVTTVHTMTGLVRSADKRAYEKARRELEAERDKAVEAGDTATFQAVDAQLEELKKTAPPPPPAAPDPTKPLPTVTTQPVAPEVSAFYARNPWYQRGGDLAREADAIHAGLLSTRKDLTLEQNLAETERRLQRFWPQEYAAAMGTTVTPQNNGAGGANGAGGGGGARNPRQDEAGDVSPSSGGGGGRRPTNTRNFDNMPRESKEAYTKYAKMLTGKGEPLTKDEWATDYWSQFEEVP